MFAVLTEEDQIILLAADSRIAVEYSSEEGAYNLMAGPWLIYQAAGEAGDPAAWDRARSLLQQLFVAIRSGERGFDVREHAARMSADVSATAGNEAKPPTGEVPHER